MSLEDAIKNATKETQEFSLCGLTLKGKVVECYDADTCKIVIPIKDSLYKFTCRLNGIDSPEMKPRKDKPIKSKKLIYFLLFIAINTHHFYYNL